MPLERYINPRKAEWPAADFVVGNPPFIGNKRMRTALGDGYVEALRATWDDVPESADFVMYWWHHAALLTRSGALQRFGFITTNSIRQAFNRRVIEDALLPKPYVPPRGDRVSLNLRGSYAPPRGDQVTLSLPENRISLVFAIPDHPWVDTADGAAVRIAMTVAQAGQLPAILREVLDEREQGDGEIAVTLREKRGRMFPDLKIGPNLTSAVTLRQAEGLHSNGFMLAGSGFIVEREFAAQLGKCERIRAYRNGRDLAQNPRGVYLIDLFGLTEAQARDDFPALFQHVLTHVKPERDQNRREKMRQSWWIVAEPRVGFRKAVAGQRRYIATVETSKHRFFEFLDADIAPDHKLNVVATEDAFVMGALSSALHVTWALAKGSRLGVGNDPVYLQTKCLRTFPFPAATAEQTERIRSLAEQLDAHRKRQQAAHPDLTMTGMYNVLEKLRSGEPLTAKERVIHEHGLVSVLRQIHDDIDAAVLDVYGWSDLLPLLRVAHGNDAVLPLPQAGEGSKAEAKRAFEEAILERLVALNAERAAEEARGSVRWLRPDFQNPQEKAAPQQAELDTEVEAEAEAVTPGAAIKPQPWPKDAVEQVRAVADVLSASAAPLLADDIAARFSGRGPWKKRLPPLLDMLVALGRAQEHQGMYLAVR